MREDREASVHSTKKLVARLTSAPHIREDLSMDCQLFSNEAKEALKDHIMQHTLTILATQ